jgi:diacylglycerol kinase (ATP)
MNPVASDAKRITLVHNSGSGWGNLSDRAVIKALERAGHVVRPVEAKVCQTEDLKKGCDVVVAAGGDGTTLGVARRIVHSPTPMVILPVGTANNLATSLGLVADLDELVETLEAPEERALDLGIATGSWGERFFVESVGVGWFCDALDSGLDKRDKPIDRALGRLAPLIEHYDPRKWTMRIDGQDCSGVYTFVDVMNAKMIGPHLCFAPRADPFDGCFDVVLASADDRARVQRYVDALRKGPDVPPLELEVRRAKHVHFALRTTERIRVDGGLCPKKEEPGSHFADIHMVPAAVRLWLPARCTAPSG